VELHTVEFHSNPGNSYLVLGYEVTAAKVDTALPILACVQITNVSVVS
jgi:hypothetical protein